MHCEPKTILVASQESVLQRRQGEVLVREEAGQGEGGAGRGKYSLREVQCTWLELEGVLCFLSMQVLGERKGACVLIHSMCLGEQGQKFRLFT